MRQKSQSQNRKLNPVATVVLFEILYLVVQAIVPVVGWADLMFPLDDIVFCAILFLLTWRGVVDKETLRALLRQGQ